MWVAIECGMMWWTRWEVACGDARRDDACVRACILQLVIEYPTIHVMCKTRTRDLDILPEPAHMPNVSPHAIAAATGTR